MEKVRSLKPTPQRNLPVPGAEAFVEAVQTAEEIATLRKRLKEITAGPAFKGSARSGQFLEFVVEQSIAGNFDQLKERLIGVELFKREPSYDTGEDAIVRVTASDVRKRLLQHYGWFGTDYEFRIDLPLGTYVPSIRRNTPIVRYPSGAQEPEQNLDARASPTDVNLPLEVTPRTIETPATVPPLPAFPVVPTTAPRSSWRATALLIMLLMMAAAAGWIFKSASSQPARSTAAAPILPWSALFNSSGTPHLVTSDANIDTVEGMTKTTVSLSDYANHRYIPQPNALTPDQLHFCKLLLSADSSVATPDLPITARVSAIAQTFSKKLSVQTARSFQLSYLNNSDDFIFLGSPRSNPWFSVFAGALSFQFIFKQGLGSEFIHNLHPQKSEQADYVPSANGGGTGYSYAVIAFVQNPDQNGNVLLLAGADGEATEAAGAFVTDLQRISGALKTCGIPATSPVRHFEMLLRTDTMAGVSRKTDIVACHMLSGSAAAATANTSNQAAAD